MCTHNAASLSGQRRSANDCAGDALSSAHMTQLSFVSQKASHCSSVPEGECQCMLLWAPVLQHGDRENRVEL